MTADGLGPMLKIANLTRRFGGLVAVDNVSFEIGRGELVGLIGPNGAGKTTLFNLISGYVQPSSGSIQFERSDISGLSTSEIAHLGISRTFQNLRLYPTITVFDNVSVGAIGALGFSWWRSLLPFDLDGRDIAIARRTREALEEAQLTDVSDHLAGYLSYGRKKYLELARALATRPALLFLDEPAAGLNDSETEELMGFVRSLNERGVTIVVVEHNVPFITSLCKRVLCLSSGRLIADGTPAEVVSSAEVRRNYLGEDYGHA